jgi:hypothetical protein
VLCIDVEPDPQRPHTPLPWQGFEQLYPYLQELRLRMSEATGEGAHLNWFWRVDPQIERVYGSAEWALRHYHVQISETMQAGDEHGVHPHAWRWDHSRNQWVHDYKNSLWVQHCVHTSLTTYKSVLGKPCEAVRLGGRFLDDQVCKTLEQLGCQFDLTVEPGEKPEGDCLQDYRTIAMEPYQPSVHDFRKRETNRAEGLWIIPLAAGVMSERGQKWRRLLRTYVSSSGPIPVGYGTLRLWEPPELVQAAVEETLENLERPYLAFAIRSDVLQNPWWGKNCRRNLEGLLGQKRARQFIFCTPRDLLCLLGFTASSSSGVGVGPET